MCRRQHGSAHSTYVQADAAAFAFVQGGEHVRDFASSPGVVRRFCALCGSKLTFVTAALPDRIWIAAGFFDDDPHVRPSYHIFVAAKAAWYEIGDDLPRHAAYPGQDAQ